MKKFLLSFITVLVICTNLITVFANDPSWQWIADNTIRVSGVAEPETNVVIQVLNPNSTASSITPGNINSKVCYHNQTMADSNGDFSFDVVLGQVNGVYTINLRFDGKTETLYVTKKQFDANININQVGHIFYDPKNVEFGLTSSSLNSYEPLTITAAITDNTGKYSGTITKQLSDTADSDGNINKTLSMDLSNENLSYGVFNVTFTITGSNASRTVEESTRFSVSKSVPAGLESSKLGTIQHFFDIQATDDMDTELDLVRKAGIKSQRATIKWGTVETTKGVYTLTSRAQELVDKTEAKRLSTMILLFGVNHDYCEKDKNGDCITDATGNCVNYRPPTTDESLAAFGNYAYNVALKSKDSADYYEVWNEFDSLGASYNPRSLGADAYVNMLKACYDKVHLGNPNAKVVGGSASLKSGYDWIEDVLKLGGGDYMDAFSYHHYPGTGLPETAVRALTNIRALLDEYGYSDMPIILSETGITSRLSGISEYEQAIREVRNLALVYDGAEQAYIYNAVEKSTDASSENGYGILRNSSAEIPLEAKPAYIAIANFSSLLSGATLASSSGDVRNGNPLYKYKFVGRDGNDIYMLWSTTSGSNTNVTLNNLTDSVTVYDVFGNPTNCVTSNHQYTFTVTDSPIYVETKKKAEIIVKDSEEFCISEFNEDEVAVEVKTDPSRKVIAVSYKDNRLLNCYFLDLEDGYYEGVVDIGDADMFKVLIWEDFQTCRPVYSKRLDNSTAK